MCVRTSVRRSVRELWLPPSWTRATLTQPRQDYTRTGTRKGVRPPVSPFVLSSRFFHVCPFHSSRALRWGRVCRLGENFGENEWRTGRRGGKKIARAITLPLCFVSTGKHYAIQRVNEFPFLFVFVRFLCSVQGDFLLSLSLFNEKLS